MKVQEFSESLRCPKCTSSCVRQEYVPELDLLKITCLRCRYCWFSRTADSGKEKLLVED